MPGASRPPAAAHGGGAGAGAGAGSGAVGAGWSQSPAPGTQMSVQYSPNTVYYESSDDHRRGHTASLDTSSGAGDSIGGAGASSYISAGTVYGEQLARQQRQLEEQMYSFERMKRLRASGKVTASLPQRPPQQQQQQQQQAQQHQSQLSQSANSGSNSPYSSKGALPSSGSSGNLRAPSVPHVTASPVHRLTHLSSSNPALARPASTAAGEARPAATDIKYTRIIFLGENNVGKHAIVHYWVANTRTSLTPAAHSTSPLPHFSPVSVLRLPMIPNDPTIDANLESIITCIDERDSAARITHYRRVPADVVVIVFSVTDRESFAKVPFWLDEANRYAPAAVKFLVATNSDRRTGVSPEKQAELVSQDEGTATANSIGAFYFEVTSTLAESYILLHHLRKYAHGIACPRDCPHSSSSNRTVS